MLCSFSLGVVYLWLSEIFPTKIRGLAMGMCIFIGRLSFMFCPYIGAYCIKLKIHPLSFHSLIGIVFFWNLIKLPETLNQKIN